MTQSPLPSRWYLSSLDQTDDPDVFPLLAGQMFVTSKKPRWSTKIVQSAAGTERRQRRWSYPLWSFKVAYEVLVDKPAASDLARLFGFFNMHAGQFQEFFYLDPSDNQVVDQVIASGNGVTTTFQLVRTQGAGNHRFNEPVRGVFGVPTFKVGGTATTGFTIGANGVVTFASPPANGATITWTGGFLFLCRFDQDELDASQMMQQLWSQSGLSFVTVKT